MIATDEFVFLHVPKTGGSFIASLLREHCEVRELGDHRSVVELPPELERLPKFAVVRNPWAWYVSYYDFMRRVDDGNPVWLALSDGGRLGFKVTTMRALGIGAPVAEHFPQPVSRGVALYRWWWWFVTRRREDLEVCRQESLRTDLAAFLERHSRNHALREAVLHAPAVNVGNGTSYRERYDDELRELVRERHPELIRRFGYDF